MKTYEVEVGEPSYGRHEVVCSEIFEEGAYTVFADDGGIKVFMIPTRFVAFIRVK